MTLRLANVAEDVKSFISYVVGCMFGRYSLDEKGVIFAGGTFDSSRYETFTADKDNILPIDSAAYFADDIVSRFVKFVDVTFDRETLVENLHFIAKVLGTRKNEIARETFAVIL